MQDGRIGRSERIDPLDRRQADQSLSGGRQATQSAALGSGASAGEGSEAGVEASGESAASSAAKSAPP